MAGDAEHKRGYRTIFRSISQVFSANAKHSSSSSNTNIYLSSSNNNNNNNHLNSNIACPIPVVSIIPACVECQDASKIVAGNKLRAISMQELNEVAGKQYQQRLSNYVIKVRRPAPQVPVRNPATALSKPRNEISNNNNNNDSSSSSESTELQQQEEESIYQTIWQYKTLEPETSQHAIDAEDDDDDDDDDEEFEIITAAETAKADDADSNNNKNKNENVVATVEAATAVEAEAEADMAALQAAAAFAAGARHKLLTKQTSLVTPATTPLPSPTASMDQGAWETDDEFMFAKAHEQQQQQAEQETLSLGSTVTNSTATLGSISSADSSNVAAAAAATPASPAQLTHPLLRNICILYSPGDSLKYRAIFYEYARHQLFATRVRRAAPPPPLPPLPLLSYTPATPTPVNGNGNDDSGCSCEADAEDATEQIPLPLRAEWERALLAAAATSKRGVAARAGRKLRVRSSARLLIPDSVLAWRQQLQHVNCCEDEEDMIVPMADILNAQKIQEDNELQQNQQTTILQRFKSASSGNLVDLPGEEDKKSIKNRMRMFAVNSNVFRINRSPKSEKKSRSRRSQVNSLYLDEPKYPLFGARLDTVELNMSNHPFVPRFVVDACAYIERPDCIEQDGIYRASGNKLLVDELKKKLTHLYDPRWLQTDDIHTLTSLHKQFFRELPSPLITQSAYERLGRNLTDDDAIERMRLAFESMPDENRSTLRFLIKHLTNVAAMSASNRMPASNLAIVWGPCLLAANDISFDIGRMNMLAKVLIENYDRIFRPDNERLVC